MSLVLIEAEIRRFLKSTEPEVLCIKGKWGVGKTYAWKKYLDDAQKSGGFELNAYSYVSLFGLNSLEELRYSIFETTVTGEHIKSGPDVRTFKALFAKGTDLGRRMRPLFDLGFAIFNKGVGEALYKTAFLSVREQLICFDDLERAGSGLQTRDVLGLASFLKEDRKCKIVLLLNDEKMDEIQRIEFNKQLEKVADTAIGFDLSSKEAVEIAFLDESALGDKIKPLIINLDITNIRIIKKIERLAIRLTSLLEGFEEVTIDQAINTLVLGGWSVYQPDVAPPIEFIRNDNSLISSLLNDHKEVDEDTKRWRALLFGYPYTNIDEFDEVVIAGVVAGYFDKIKLQGMAKKIEFARRRALGGEAHNKIWHELYYGSLDTDDDDFLDALYKNSMADAGVIGPSNINAAIRMLREFGRNDQADEVLSNYIHARKDDGIDFFNIASHHFSRDDKIEPGLLEAFAERWHSHIDERDPFEVLRKMGERQGWNDNDIALMARQSVDDFEHMFESLRGDDVRQSINILLAFCRCDEDGADKILRSATEALKRIAAKSPLRALKIQRFGISLETPIE